jgi:hypothetical protein
MSHRIIVLDEAEDELIAAQRWYETQRPGLGQEFRKAIDEAMDRLAEAPLTASPIFNPSTPLKLGGCLLSGFRIRSSLSNTTRIFGLKHLLTIGGGPATGEND